MKVNQNKVKKEFANKLVVYEKSGHHGKDIQDFFENIWLQKYILFNQSYSEGFYMNRTMNFLSNQWIHVIMISFNI